VNEAERTRAIRALYRARPRSRLLRASLALLVVASAAVWASGEIAVGDLFSARRAANLRRFLTSEIVPFELRGRGFDPAGLARWAGERWRAPGREATLATAAIAVAAMALAALFAALVAPLAARTLARAEPYLDARRERTPPLRRALLRATRIGCVLLRAIPEYVWAFFLLAVLPGSAWPAVLALALHNGGILGRLYGDTLENVDRRPLAGLAGLGAGRAQLYLVAAFPLALPRFLLYYFYRFETCVREATVLGMLGIVSLGYSIAEARARHFYDEMLLFVGFGVVIVLCGDAASYLVRGWARRAR